MRKPRHLFKTIAAVTLVELMMATTSGVIVIGAVLYATLALQQSYAAVQNYSAAEDEQLRISDYMALDVRRANSASVANNVLTLTIPDYYDSNNNPRDPTFSNNVITYGATPLTIRYYKLGVAFVREVNGTVTAIANNVASFNVVPQDLTANIAWTITFSPGLTRNVSADTIQGSAAYSSTFLRNAGARQ